MTSFSAINVQRIITRLGGRLQKRMATPPSHLYLTPNHPHAFKNVTLSMVPHEGRHQRKRRREEPLHPDGCQPPSAKKRKTERPNHSLEFWNTLSTVHITWSALKEFDRTSEDHHTQLARPEGAPPGRRLLRSDTRRLKQLASEGGLDLSALRGYSDRPTKLVTMSKSSSSSRKRSFSGVTGSSSRTDKTRSTTPYSANFEQLMTDRGIYPNGYCMVNGKRPPKPENLEDIRRMLAMPRQSLSPSAFSEGAFEDFQDRNNRAKAESQVMADVIPIIAGTKDKQCYTTGDVLFNNLEKFDPTVSTPKPDKYYGANTSQIDECVRHDLSCYVIPSSQTSLPAAPNYFLAGKGPSGRQDVAQRQAMYDGAIGARAMLKLQNHGKAKVVYDGNAYTIGSTYCDGQLKMYATHPRMSTSRPGDTEYYTTQLRVYAMTDTPDSFRYGAAAYRNGREWAQQQRDDLIASANDAALRMSMETRSSSQGNSNDISSIAKETLESTTSLGELSADHNEENTKRRQRRRKVK